jgi:hypothetical protein
VRFVVPLLAVSLVSNCLARTWTSKEGVTFEGELVEATVETATLKSPKLRKPLVVPIPELATPDQIFVRAWHAEQAREKEAVARMHPYQRRQYELLKATRGIEGNFEEKWPGIVSAPGSLEVRDLSEEGEGEQFVYHSSHYEFVCDVPLKKSLVKRLAVLFEASREYCRQLPISSKKAHVAGLKHRNRILLFETKEGYTKAGGPPGSAGVYIGGKDVIMVPLTSLGVKKVGSSYSIDYDRENRTLPHELTHQLTDHYYFRSGARGWFSEGLAEYVGATPYRSGSFNVKKALTAIRDYVTGFGRNGKGGRALGDEISAPDLKSYMLQSYGSFVANGNFNYGMGLLITTYFFHFDRDGDRVAIVAFLKALREGKEGEEALAALRQGRTWDELEDQISAGWRGRGLRIRFQ